jgi:excinuclease UvrABC nuclease subunit
MKPIRNVFRILSAILQRCGDDSASNVASVELEEHALSIWLRQQGEAKNYAQSAQKRYEKDLVNMAAKLHRKASALKTQWENDTNKQSEALTELHRHCNTRAPNRNRMLCISNTQGTLSSDPCCFEQGFQR